MPDTGANGSKPFPTGLKFSGSLDSINMRMLILGWLDKGRASVIEGGSISELRVAVQMLAGLTEKISAHELALFEQKRKTVLKKVAKEASLGRNIHAVSPKEAKLKKPKAKTNRSVAAQKA